ncbi:sensor histidine kinase [Nocardiopsis sp. NPDC050513]|uniref:sensor histidine kinase n=1 Tax=Nocardiopsis sp. NPDC050513 TaxID=3364338 RepID=UPI0037B0CAFF
MTGGLGTGRGGNGEDAGADRRIRVARRALVASMSMLDALFVFFVLLDAVSAAVEGIALWPSVVALPLAVGAAVLLHLLFLGRLDGRREPAPGPYWGSVVLIVLCCAAVQSPLHRVIVLALWWAVVVFVASRRRGAAVSALTLALPWLLIPFTQVDVQIVPFLVTWALGIVYALMLCVGMLTCVWLWEIVNDAVAGQRARARLAVTEERLRFSRDMHDLLGHSLSALAVKAELASRLAGRDRERAAAEIAEVRALARTSLAQVRAAVSGYREVSLAEEVASVSAVLRADRTEVTVTGLDGVEASPGAAALAAWVVREGATNVLRHSDATRCRIVFTRTADASAGPRALVVEVANDRARSGERREAASGNGLAGLSERVAAGGGSLSAARTGDGGFLLRAVLPL